MHIELKHNCIVCAVKLTGASALLSQGYGPLCPSCFFSFENRHRKWAEEKRSKENWPQRMELSYLEICQLADYCLGLRLSLEQHVYEQKCKWKNPDTEGEESTIRLLSQWIGKFESFIEQTRKEMN